MPTHREKRVLPYTPEQIFDLVADVERYPEFLPGWVAARVLKREGNVYYTDQVIRFAMVRQRFRSKTVLRRPERIDVTATDGPVRNLHLTWHFDALPDGECQVSLTADLELRSRPIQDLFGRAVSRTVGSIMSAFEARARRLYDPAPGSCGTAGEPASSDTMI